MQQLSEMSEAEVLRKVFGISREQALELAYPPDGTAGNPTANSTERQGSMTQEAKTAEPVGKQEQAKVEARIRTDVVRDLQEAGKAGDTDAMQKYSNELTALQKVEESIKRARVVNDRKAIEDRIIAQIKPILAKERAEIVRTGGVLRILSEPENSELLTASIGAKSERTVSTGTGGGGKVEERFGKRLSVLFAEIATPEEQGKHDSQPSGKEGNSRRWQIMDAAIKRAVKDGVITPIS